VQQHICKCLLPIEVFENNDKCERCPDVNINYFLASCVTNHSAVFIQKLTVSQQFLPFIEPEEFHCYVHKSQPPFPTLTPPPPISFGPVLVNTVPSRHKPQSRLLPSQAFPIIILYIFFISPCLLHTPPISSSLFCSC
jgi:hypothetical protein